jgi:hypothetical protein
MKTAALFLLGSPFPGSLSAQIPSFDPRVKNLTEQMTLEEKSG